MMWIIPLKKINSRLKAELYSSLTESHIVEKTSFRNSTPENWILGVVRNQAFQKRFLEIVGNDL